MNSGLSSEFQYYRRPVIVYPSIENDYNQIYDKFNRSKAKLYNLQVVNRCY